MDAATRAFALLGTVDAGPWAALLTVLPEARWHEHRRRQERSPGIHGATTTIPLRLRDEGVEVVADDLLATFGPLLDEVGGLVSARHPGRRALGNVLAVRLPAGAEVAPHQDGGHYLRVVRRVHVTLATNDRCTFTADGAEHRPRSGDVHELDNQRPHAARNAGATDRIHLICDWLVDGVDAGR